MRVRDWQEILEDVVESNGDAADWRAVAGNRQRGLGEEMFLGHPKVGVYHLTTYAKNPFDVQGVGSRVARKIDDELEPMFPNRHSGGRFGVNSPVEDKSEAEKRAQQLESVLQTHADAPTTKDALFEDMMSALDSPAFGPIEFTMNDRPDGLDKLSSTFDESSDILTKELDDLIEADEVDKGFY